MILQDKLGQVRAALGFSDKFGRNRDANNPFPSFQTLTLTIMHHQSSLNAASVFLLRPSITSLTLRTTSVGCPSSKPPTIVESIAPLVPHLNSLTVDGCVYKSGPDFAVFGSLTVLQLSSVYINLEAWKSLAALPNLMHLGLTKTMDWWGMGALGIKEWRAAEGEMNQLFPSLEVVVIEGRAHEDGLAPLVVLGSIMPMLQTLTIPGKCIHFCIYQAKIMDDMVKHLQAYSPKFKGILDDKSRPLRRE